MPYIDPDSQQTVNVVRYTADTRSTTTSVVANIIMDIQPAGGGASQQEGLHLASANEYVGIPQTKQTGLRQGDVVQATGYNDLYIMRIDESGDVQVLRLSERGPRVL